MRGDYNDTHRFLLVDCPSDIAHSYCVNCGVSMMHARRRLLCPVVALAVNIQQSVSSQPQMSIALDAAQQAAMEAMRKERM